MKKYIPHIIILSLVIPLSLSIERCNYIHNKNVVDIVSLSDTIMYFKNRIGIQTASINTLQLDKNQLQNLVLDKDAELAKLTAAFSKVNTIVKYKTVMQIDTIRISYKDSVPCVFERSGELKKDWYSFTYKSDQKGIQIDSLKTWTSTTAITGFKRKWFLGEQTAVTDITNSNPHIVVTGLQAIEIVVPEPWYKKWYVWLTAGICGGWITSR
ncbi:hypothetical protein D3C87_395610 [compost metagenome]